MAFGDQDPANNRNKNAYDDTDALVQEKYGLRGRGNRGPNRRQDGDADDKLPQTRDRSQSHPMMDSSNGSANSKMNHTSDDRDALLQEKYGLRGKGTARRFESSSTTPSDGSKNTNLFATDSNQLSVGESRPVSDDRDALLQEKYGLRNNVTARRFDGKSTRTSIGSKNASSNQMSVGEGIATSSDRDAVLQEKYGLRGHGRARKRDSGASSSMSSSSTTPTLSFLPNKAGNASKCANSDAGNDQDSSERSARGSTSAGLRHNAAPSRTSLAKKASQDSDSLPATSPPSSTAFYSSESLPGAYSGTSGNEYQRNPSLRVDLFACTSDQQQQQETRRSNVREEESTQRETETNHMQADVTLANTAPNERDKEWYQNKKYVLIGVAGCIALLVVIIIAVVLTAGGGSKSSLVTSSPSPQGTEATNPPEIDPTWVPGLQQFTIDALEDIQSPQYKALQWTMMDPNWKTYGDYRKQQRYALSTFYHSFGGPLWPKSDPQASKWLNFTLHECEWFRYEDACNDDGKLEVLNFTRLSRFRGTVPPEVVMLDQLQVIDFSYNLLNTELAELLPLQEQNSMLPNLSVLVCSMCRLQSSIPSELGILTALQELIMDENTLTANIPSEIGSMTFLQTIDLAKNQLSGHLPSEIGLALNLEYLYLFNNQLSSLPTEVGYLESLKKLDVSTNKIAQSLPTEVGLITQLEQLNLWKNSFTGSLPLELNNLSKLTSLSLTNNGFSGSLPPQMFQSLSSLNQLWINNNNFQGPIPQQISFLSNLTRIIFDSNQLTSTIPSEMGSLDHLTSLNLNDNQFTGSIPKELSNLDRLEELDLSGNQLTGSIPSDFANLDGLTTLNVEGNSYLDQFVPDGLCRPDLDFQPSSWCP